MACLWRSCGLKWRWRNWASVPQKTHQGQVGDNERQIWREERKCLNWVKLRGTEATQDIDTFNQVANGSRAAVSVRRISHHGNWTWRSVCGVAAYAFSLLNLSTMINSSLLWSTEHPCRTETHPQTLSCSFWWQSSLITSGSNTEKSSFNKDRTGPSDTDSP